RIGQSALASNVAELIRLLNTSKASFVLAHAQRSGLTPISGTTPGNKNYAPFVTSHLRRQTRARSVVQGLADTSSNRNALNKTDLVKSVVELESPVPVFNLEVEGDHEY